MQVIEMLKKGSDSSFKILNNYYSSNYCWKFCLNNISFSVEEAFTMELTLGSISVISMFSCSHIKNTIKKKKKKHNKYSLK